MGGVGFPKVIDKKVKSFVGYGYSVLTINVDNGKRLNLELI